MDGRVKRKKVEFFFRSALITGFISALLMLPAGLVSAENPDQKTIVTIDTGKIMEAHPAFIKAQKTFEGEIQGMQEKMQGMGQEEQMLAQQQMQQQAQQRGEQLQKDALGEMKKDLQKIAGEKGYDYVFDANSLIVGGRDVTDEVIKAMNQKEEKAE